MSNARNAIVRTAAVISAFGALSLGVTATTHAATGGNPGDIMEINNFAPTCANPTGTLVFTNNGSHTVAMSLSHLEGANYSKPDFTIKVPAGQTRFFDGKVAKGEHVEIGLVGRNTVTGAVYNFTDVTVMEWSRVGC